MESWVKPNILHTDVRERLINKVQAENNKMPTPMIASHFLKETTEDGINVRMWCGVLQHKHTFYLHFFGLEGFVKCPPRLSAPICHSCWEEIYKRLNAMVEDRQQEKELSPADAYDLAMKNYLDAKKQR